MTYLSVRCWICNRTVRHRIQMCFLRQDRLYFDIFGHHSTALTTISLSLNNITIETDPALHTPHNQTQNHSPGSYVRYCGPNQTELTVNTACDANMKYKMNVANVVLITQLH